MTGTLITLSGIDGSGKSTISKELSRRLEDEGFDTSYHYGRYTSKIARPIMVLGESYLQSSSKGNYDEYSKQKSELLDTNVTKNLYEFILMSDYLPFLYSSIKYKLLFNDYVICDRYFQDTILKNFGGQVVTDSDDAVALYNKYRRFVPTPDYSYFLEISIAESMRRKDDIPSIEYIREQQSLYEQFVPQTDMNCIDGSANVDIIVDQIYGEIV